MKTLTMKERLAAFQESMSSLCKQELSDDNALIAYYNADYEAQSALKALSKFYLNNDLGGCGTCFVDATAQLLALDLNSDVANKEEISFELYAGALLQDTVNFDSSKSVSNYNLTNANAWWHLSQNPSKIKS